jgi:hypothetical protein
VAIFSVIDPQVLKEMNLGRIINPEGSGKERNRITRSVALALRELMSQNHADEKTKDLAAYISLALQEIDETVEASVAPWEKRGYWVKADRFRLEWIWAGQLGNKMKAALLEEDWQSVALSAAQVAEKLKNVKLPKRNRLGTPWDGAWEKISNGVDVGSNRK